MEIVKKIAKALISFPFNVIIWLLVLAAIYHFFLFFAYDLNPNYLQMHNCKQVDGTWDGTTKRCMLRAQ